MFITRPVTCGGTPVIDGYIKVTPSGGVGPYTCSLDSGAYGDCTMYNISSGPHTVSVLDSYSCVYPIQSVITVLENAPLTVSTTLVNNVNCYGEV